MSSHEIETDQDHLDYIIRWTLRESVNDALPPPGTWQQIEQNILTEQRSSWVKYFSLDIVLALGAWLGRLIETNTALPTYHGHRSVKHTYAVDMWAPLSIVSIIEGRMLGLRVVS